MTVLVFGRVKSSFRAHHSILAKIAQQSYLGNAIRQMPCQIIQPEENTQGGIGDGFQGVNLANHTFPFSSLFPLSTLLNDRLSHKFYFKSISCRINNVNFTFADKC